MKKIYLVTQNVNHDYDTYDSMVVVCDNAEQARYMHPDGSSYDEDDSWGFTHAWCEPCEVEITLIGVSDSYTENTVILSSFNAG